jgi:hypothetical protein
MNSESPAESSSQQAIQAAQQAMETTSPHPPQADVLLYVEQEAPSKFRIASDQLEQIGAKLRGRPRFSLFNSIMLPALVTLLTTVLTGTFQYLSWLNTVRLQAANAIADHATGTLEKASTLIGERRYATLIFIPSVRGLAQSTFFIEAHGTLNNAELTLRHESHGDNTGVVPVSDEDRRTVVGQQLAAASFALERRRYDDYYRLLTSWNAGYDQLIADIDDNLDAPIFADAGVARTASTNFHKKIGNISCSSALPEALENVGLNEHSLKLQFVAISQCFQLLHHSLDVQLSKVLHRSIDNLDSKMIEDADKRLSDILTTSNEFRCVALLRIDYYKQRKERAIVAPILVRHWLFDPVKAGAGTEFSNEDYGCNPEHRPT